MVKNKQSDLDFVTLLFNTLASPPYKKTDDKREQYEIDLENSLILKAELAYLFGKKMIEPEA